ncbi:MAG: hypothetical protein ACRDPK_06790 [Carbonactinosporaceae bacterium]
MASAVLPPLRSSPVRIRGSRQGGRGFFFTYIWLWEALAIVAVIDLGLPGWLVPVVAVGVLAAGESLVRRYIQVLPSATARDSRCGHQAAGTATVVGTIIGRWRS